MNFTPKLYNRTLPVIQTTLTELIETLGEDYVLDATLQIYHYSIRAPRMREAITELLTKHHKKLPEESHQQFFERISITHTKETQAAFDQVTHNDHII